MKELFAIVIILFSAGVGASSFTNINMPSSKFLDDKPEITIALPSSYSFKESNRYPVLYVLDGELNAELVFSMLSRLHKSNGSDEYIVVGITSANRLKDFTPTVNKDPRGPLGEGGGADKFLDYVHYELIPFINRKYRSNHNNIILGHSIAGLFVVHAFHARAGLFQAHLAFSPAVWWGNGEVAHEIQSYLSSENDKPGFLYMNIGGEHGSMRKQYDAFSNIVLRNRSTDLVLQLDEFNTEEHNFTMVVGLYNALRELQRYRKIMKL